MAEVTVVGFRAVEQNSATKTSMSIRETPQAISVITRDSMDARQIRGQELDGRRDVRMDGCVVASRTFDMVAFERIEVIKGPSSVDP
jgi:outer membrane receptor for ferric coprogen and ferric-rhodotorulic acid